MNLPFLRSGGLLLASLFSSLVTTGFPASAATIYHPKSGLANGWASVVWGDLTVEPSKAVVKEAGGFSLLVTPTAVAAPYAGLQIVAEGGGGIVLTDALRKAGEVRLYLCNGTDVSGGAAAGQTVQVMLSFQADGGKVLNGQYERAVLDPASADGKVPVGWQLVRLSIPGQLRGKADPTTPMKLRGVYVQYVDQPMAGFYVGECIATIASAK